MYLFRWTFSIFTDPIGCEVSFTEPGEHSLHSAVKSTVHHAQHGAVLQLGLFLDALVESEAAGHTALPLCTDLRAVTEEVGAHQARVRQTARPVDDQCVDLLDCTHRSASSRLCSSSVRGSESALVSSASEEVSAETRTTGRVCYLDCTVVLFQLYVNLQHVKLVGDRSDESRAPIMVEGELPNEQQLRTAL